MYMGCQMSKKESEIEEVEITLEPTLEELYQKWFEELEKDYDKKEKMSKPIRPAWISDKDLCRRLQFLRSKGEIMAHVVVEALVKQFTNKFNLPPKKFVTVLAENKMKEIKKQLDSYKDHTGIKMSFSEALGLNWTETTQHWKELHEMLSLAIKKIRVLRKVSLSDVLKPISEKAHDYFSKHFDARLVYRLIRIEDEVSDLPKLKDLTSDVKIAENLASTIEEVIKEYRETAMGK